MLQRTRDWSEMTRQERMDAIVAVFEAGATSWLGMARGLAHSGITGATANKAGHYVHKYLPQYKPLISKKMPKRAPRRKLIEGRDMTDGRAVMGKAIRQMRAREQIVGAKTPMPSPDHVEGFDRPDPLNIHLWELTSKTCRFPLWAHDAEPSADDMLFCGHPIDADGENSHKVYCPYHRRLARDFIKPVNLKGRKPDGEEQGQGIR